MNAPLGTLARLARGGRARAHGAAEDGREQTSPPSPPLAATADAGPSGGIASSGAGDHGKAPAGSGTAADDHGKGPGGPGSAAPAGKGAPERARTCSNCKAPLDDEQDWCTQCGEQNERSMAARAGAYSAAALVVCAVFASGAAAAGVAALTQGSVKEPPHRRIIAQTVPTAPTTPPPATPTTPGSPETLKVPNAHPAGGLGTATSATRATTQTTASAAGGGAAAPGSTSSQSSSTTTTSSASSPAASGAHEAIELRPQDLSRYDPENAYPRSALSDPRKGFKQRFEEGGDVPYWTVTVLPGRASKLNVGLLIDLREAKHVGSLELRTPTPGFPVEVLGANGSSAPASRGASGWAVLGHANSLKRHETLKLGEGEQSFRYLLLWIGEVPARFAGSVSAPGHVSIGEAVPVTP